MWEPGIEADSYGRSQGPSDNWACMFLSGVPRETPPYPIYKTIAGPLYLLRGNSLSGRWLSSLLAKELDEETELSFLKLTEVDRWSGFLRFLSLCFF